MKKKTPSEEVTEKIDLNELFEEAMNEDDWDETEDPEKTDVLEVSELEEKPKKAKVVKKAKKTSKKVAAKKKESKEEPKDKKSDAKEATAETKKAASKKTAPKSTKVEKEPTTQDYSNQNGQVGSAFRMDASISAAAMQSSMEQMVKHWSSIREISQQINTNLEKSSELLKSFPEDYHEALKEVAKHNSIPQKHSPFSQKMAVGVSSFALILSLLSFSFSQNMRKNLLQANVIPKATANKIIAQKEARKVPPAVATKKPTKKKINKRAKTTTSKRNRNRNRILKNKRRGRYKK